MSVWRERLERAKRWALRHRRVAAAVAAVLLLVVSAIALSPAQAPSVKSRAELVAILGAGKLTPDQAADLARMLEAGAFAGAPASAPPVARTEADRALRAFSAATHETYRDAARSLLRSPDPEVREAILHLSQRDKRAAALQTLWQAAGKPAATSAGALYRLIAAVGLSASDPVGLEALVRARTLNPQDAQLWRMTAFSADQAGDVRAAHAADFIEDGLVAQSRAKFAQAEDEFAAASFLLTAPRERAFVEGMRGDIAAVRNDWAKAAGHYGEALAQWRRAQASVVDMQRDLQRHVRALDRDGRTAEACAAARGVATIDDADFKARCARLSIDLDAVAPQGDGLRNRNRAAP